MLLSKSYLLWAERPSGLLQVTRRILSLTQESWLKANQRTRQKVMISAGRWSSDVASRQDRTSGDARPSRDARTGSNGYKNVLELIITLVVVNSHSIISSIVLLLHRLVLVILFTIELVCLSLVNSYNSSPPQSPDNHRTVYFNIPSRPNPDRDVTSNKRNPPLIKELGLLKSSLMKFDG